MDVLQTILDRASLPLQKRLHRLETEAGAKGNPFQWIVQTDVPAKDSSMPDTPSHAVAGGRSIADVASPAVSPPRKRTKTSDKDPNMICIDGQHIHILDYVASQQFLELVEKVNDPELEVTFAGHTLRTTAKSWQAIGQERLAILAFSVFKGALLGDPVGLGKSLTALLAATRIRRAQKQRGFILIVCRKSCIFQWKAEIEKHFKPEHRPRVAILDRPNFRVQELLTYDIVICGQGYIRTRFAEASGQRKDKQLVYMPLHSALYQRLQKPISVLIIDESQDGKNTKSQLAQAIRSLTPLTTFCLSGTLVHNRWHDLYSQLSFLPGCPFTSLSHFRMCFGVDSDDSRSSPPAARMLLLKRLLAAMTIVRPKELLNLPQTHVEVIEVNLEDYPDVVRKIEQTLNMARSLLDKASKSRRKRSSSTKIKKAFKLLYVAQSRAASSLLLWKVPEALEPGQKTEKHDKPKASSEKDSSETEEDESSDEHSDKDGNKSRKNTARVSYTEEFCYAEDANDATYEDDPPGALDESGSDSSNDSYTENKQRLSRGQPEYDRQWMEYLSQASDEDLFSPRVEAILTKIAEIRQSHATDKIIVSSQSVKFLDIVQEAMCRVAREIPVFVMGKAVFNGTIASAQDRYRVIRDFNIAGHEPWILFLSAEAGGTGLNIAGASHLLISEPFYTDGQEQQLRGRVERIPQDKEVFVYHFVASLSKVDLFLTENRLNKKDVRDDIMEHLIRNDSDPLVLPQLPQQRELA